MRKIKRIVGEFLLWIGKLLGVIDKDDELIERDRGIE